MERPEMNQLYPGIMMIFQAIRLIVLRKRLGAMAKINMMKITYAIFRRLNTGTLATSRINAKTTVDTSIPPTTNMGKDDMAIP